MLDIVIMIFIGLGAYSGYKRGLFIGIISIVAFLIGLILAFKFMDWGTAILAERMDTMTYLLPVVSFIIIFLAVTIIIRILAFLVKKSLDLTILGTFDNFAGAVLGIAKWIFMISLMFWLAGSFQFSIPFLDQETSQLYPLVAPIAPTVIAFIDNFSPVIQDSIDSMIELINKTKGDITA